MKKLFAILLASTVLFLGACKKDKTETLEAVATGSWTLGTQTFSIKYSGVTNASGRYSLIFAEKTPAAGVFNFLTVGFKAEPTVGTYDLVSMANNAPIATSTQCQVGASDNTATGGYGYIGAAGVTKIVVEKVNGKLKISIPEIKVTGSTGTEVKLYGVATEI